ncbi:TPA: anti-phage protein KwaA [Vibrio mimicus]
MKLSAQIKLYILSLAILFLIVFLITVKLDICTNDRNCTTLTWKDYALSNWLPMLMLIAMGYCEIVRRQFEHMLDGGAGDSLYIVECQSESYEHLTFLATYIIPFFGFSFTETGRLLAYGVLLVVIGAIFIKTDKYYANPTLALFGYKLYRVTMSDASHRYESVIVITKNTLTANQPVNYKLLSSNVYYVRKIVQ